MISKEQAEKLLGDKYPKLIITKIVDYDDDHYVIEAVKSLEEPDYNLPYYGVDKNTGEITSFSPGEDLDYFFEKMGIDEADDDDEEELSDLFDEDDEEMIVAGRNVVSRFLTI